MKGRLESRMTTPVGPPKTRGFDGRFQLMEVSHLKGVRLGSRVRVNLKGRIVDGRLRWMGKCDDDYVALLQFSKDVVEQGQEHVLLDGQRLPRLDDEEHVFRLVRADWVQVPDGEWRHANNVRLAEVWANGRNNIGRRVSFSGGRLSGKLVWSGEVDGQKVAAVLLDEGLPPNGTKPFISADNLIRADSHICNRITVEPADGFHFLDGDQPVSNDVHSPGAAAVVPMKWPDFNVGDLVRIVEDDSYELVGAVRHIEYRLETDEVLVLVEVEATQLQRPCPRLCEFPVIQCRYICPHGRALWLSSVGHVTELATKAKEIPRDASVSCKLDYNVEMKFVDQSTKRTYIGCVRWIGTVMGQRMAALEVDKPGECATVKKCPQLVHLVPLPIGKDVLFVPVEDLDPVLQSDRRQWKSSYSGQDVTRSYFGIPHTEQFFADLRELNANDRVGGVQLNMAVEVHFVKMNIWRTGVCRWLGVQDKEGLHVVGVELDEKTFEGSSDGLFPLGAEKPRRFFWCRDKYGILVSKQLVREDRRNVMVRDAENRGSVCVERLKVTEVEMIDKESLPPVIWKPEYSKKYGVQGKANSCYMDSTLFALFFTNNSFDYILGPQTTDTENIAELRHLMRTSIVNPLRQNVFVGHASVMAFRRKFEEVGKTQGMTYDQKDPAEFLTVFFDVLRIRPLMVFSDGDKTSILQLFFQCSSSSLSPTGMLRLSFQELGNVKLKETPRNLIMLIPRKGSRYSGFQHLQLDLQLRISEFLESSNLTDRRKCYYPSCHEPAPFECHHKTQSVLLCRKHQNNCPKCRDHEEPHHLMDMEPTLELFAVLCIETSHYVTFVRDYDHSADKRQWYFFDSMADRMCELDAGWYTGDDTVVNETRFQMKRHFLKLNDTQRLGKVNVPEITKLNNMEEDVKKYNEHLQTYKYPKHNVEPHVKRLFTSAYVLLYRNERTLVYEDDV